RLGALEPQGEEETQRCNRAIERTHAGLRLIQLEKAKILRRGRIRRAAEKGCKCPDVPDIVVVRLLDEVAHRHVFDHAPAQRADGLLAHWELLVWGSPCQAQISPNAHLSI